MFEFLDSGIPGSMNSLISWIPDSRIHWIPLCVMLCCSFRYVYLCDVFLKRPLRSPGRWTVSPFAVCCVFLCPYFLMHNGNPIGLKTLVGKEDKTRAQKQRKSWRSVLMQLGLHNLQGKLVSVASKSQVAMASHGCRLYACLVGRCVILAFLKRPPTQRRRRLLMCWAVCFLRYSVKLTLRVR